MKSISKLAIALAMGAMMVTPAAHARKKKEDKTAETAPQRDLSKGFLAAYSTVYNLWKKDNDVESTKAAFPTLLAAVESEDDRFEAGVFILNLGIELKDQSLQSQGIDQLLMSSSTTAEQRGTYLFQKGAFAYDGKDYAMAEDFMKKAYDTGYRARNIEILIANAQGQMKKYAEGTTWIRRAIDSEIAAGKTADISWYALGANYALKASDDAAANIWLKDVLRNGPTPNYWHDSLVIYMGTVDLDLSEKLDVMRLMRLNKAMLYEQDYVRYIESVNPARYPNEAYNVLEEGFTSGVISRNAVTFSEEWNIAKKLLAESDAGAPLTEKDARAAAGSYQTVLGGEVFLARGEYKIAAELYQMALAKGRVVDKQGVDQTDRTWLRLAISQIAIGALDDARNSLSKIETGDRKEIADYWMIYLDAQATKAAI